MNNTPFFISTAAAGVCTILGALHLVSGSANLGIQREFQTKEQQVQELREAVELKQREFQTQQQIIEAGSTVAQKYGPPILRDLGYLAAKNKNEKIKAILTRQHLESFILDDEQVKQVDEQLKKAQTEKGGAATPQ